MASAGLYSAVMKILARENGINVEMARRNQLMQYQ